MLGNIIAINLATNLSGIIHKKKREKHNSNMESKTVLELYNLELFKPSKTLKYVTFKIEKNTALINI